jgi:uncharacterized protein (TIGR02466 family)
VNEGAAALPTPHGPLKRIGDVPAFGVHIDGFVLPDHEALNRALRDEIAVRIAAEEGLSASNRKGWHSQRDLFQRSEPAAMTLRNHIVVAMTAAARRYTPEFDPRRHKTFLEGWINVNRQGGYNSPHGHSGAHLSGSYYVSVPEAADAAPSNIEFLHPASTIPRDWALGRAMVTPSVSIKPIEGQMLIFPSYLQHWVQPNEADADRISIAFNMTVMVDRF